MTTPPTEYYVPYLRRRNTPAQLRSLNQLFEATPHPTRAQRQALANEIGMELKSVTNWFQNRRQTSRRKSLPSNENNPPKTRLSRSPTRPQRDRSNTPLDRSKISLDRIAALSERPSLTLQLNSACLPLTPRKGNVPLCGTSELWTHMLSSPAAPAPSPGPEEARLEALLSQTMTHYPLEWACLKARQKKWDDEDAKEDSYPVLESCREVDEEDEDEDTLDIEKRGVLAPRAGTAPLFEDVEAAITLLDFKTRS